MAKTILLSALVLLTSIHGICAHDLETAGLRNATTVLAQTLYASPPTPTVPILSASSPWLTTTKPTATFGAINTPTPYPQTKIFPSYFPGAKIAHAVLGAVAFLVVFPLGGIIIKVWPHRHIVWIHAAIQGFGLIVYIVCIALGFLMGRQLNTLNRYHAGLGYVVFACLLVQPMLKLHWISSAVPRVAMFMQIHVWLGRTALMLGTIDGGLGFRLSSALSLHGRHGSNWPVGWKIAYGVLGGIVWVVYVGVCVVWVEFKRVPHAAPVSPGAPPEEVLALAEQFEQERNQELKGLGHKRRDSVTTASAVDSDLESAVKVAVMPKRASRPAND